VEGPRHQHSPHRAAYDPALLDRAHLVEEWTNMANALGLKMIRNARPDPSKDDNESNLLAWEVADEPDNIEEDALGTGHVQKVIDRYKALKKINNSRPVFVNLIGLWVGAPDDRYCNGIGDYDTVSTNCYPGFISAMDWLSQDELPGEQPRPMNSTAHRWTSSPGGGSGKPQFTFIEASKIRANSVP
jgi:hypothetical protein